MENLILVHDNEWLGNNDDETIINGNNSVVLLRKYI